MSSTDTVRVMNHRASLVTLPLVSVVETKSGDIRSSFDLVLNENSDTKRVITSYGRKKLMPGVNYVMRAYMEALKGHAGVDLLFQCKDLEIVSSGEPIIPSDVRTSLRGTDESNALQLVAIAGDVPQLERWLHSEERQVVSRAIATRLQALRAGEASPGKNLKKEATESLSA